MKKLLSIIFVVALAGCAGPSKFDSSLYDRLVVLSVDAAQAESSCGRPEMKGIVFALNHESKVAVKYTLYTAKDTNTSVTLVDKAITEMNNAYTVGTPSEAYCQLKLKVISADLELILTGIGGKH